MDAREVERLPAADCDLFIDEVRESAVEAGDRLMMRRTIQGETKARFAMHMARPKVHMPRNAPMPRWMANAMAMTMGRVRRGQTRAQYDNSQNTVMCVSNEARVR